MDITAPLLSTQDSNLQLCQIIGQHIAKSPNQRISFAEYMNWVLYHPQHGYYATNQVNIGAGGDFFTAPHLGADFGELLAEQFVEMWKLLSYPKPFTLVEIGAGQGLLVQDVLHYLHRHYFECFDAMHYIVVEKSAALRAEQQQRLKALSRFGDHLSWQTWDEIPLGSIVGCCFSNELVDAFPVHQFVWERGELQEVYVTCDRTSLQFSEIIDQPSTTQLLEYFELNGIDLKSAAYPEGYRSEINLAALEWLATVASRLQCGYILTIDYGYTADRYYLPTRTQGTLQCYYQHAHHSDPYINIGRQDITAHVDFTALKRQGERCGLSTIGFTQQGLFLLALGLGDRIAALSHHETTETQSINDILRRREALHALANPLGLGNFGVLIQSKGLNDTAIQLKGLSAP